MDPATMALVNLITAPLGTVGTLAVLVMIFKGRVSEKFLGVINDLTSIKEDIKTIKETEKECKKSRESVEKELSRTLKIAGEDISYLKGLSNGRKGGD